LLYPKFRLSAIAAVCCVLVSPAVVLAQQTLGGIVGTVTDSSGNVVPDASITIVDEGTHLTRSTTSNSTGAYTFPNLPIGTYTLTFSHPGFSQERVPSITVQADRTLTIPAQLAIGAVTAEVTVDASPLMNAVDTTNGYVLDKEQIDAIPLPTGSFTGVAILSPGVNAELPGGTGANSGLGNAPIWANGQRDISNSFLLNGVDGSNLFNGKSTSQVASARVVNNTGVGNSGAGGVEQSSASVYLAIGNALPTPAPETLEEVRVNASMYDAQQGSTSGAHIDLSTSSGTNVFHGSLYARRGTDWLNAAPFFFKQDGDIPANEKVPQLHRLNAGFTAGGPILKDKLFFFAGYQHVHVADQEIGISRLTVPPGLTDTNRTVGGLAALANNNFGTTIAPAQISPVALFLFNYKLPNGRFLIPSATPGVIPNANTPDNASIPGTGYFTSDQAVTDLDWNATKKDTLAVKYYYQHDPTTAPYAYSNVGGFTQSMDAGSHVFSLSNTYNIKSNLSTTQTLGFNRMKAYGTNTQPFTAGQAGISAFGSSYFPGISIVDVLGNDNAGGQNPDGLYDTSLNVGPGAFTQGPFTGLFQNRLMPSASGIWSLGKHTVAFGGSYSYTQLNIRDQRTNKGMISTADLPGFLTGEISYQNNDFTTTTFLVGNANRYYRANQVGLYLQDKFQVTPTLSLSAGIRYDWDAGLTEKNGNIFNFDPTQYSFNPACLTSTLMTSQQCYPKNGFVIASNNKQATAGASKTTLTGRQWGIGPRLGAAWQPKMFESKVVVRTGMGLYYDRGENFSFLSPGYAAGEVTGGPFGVNQAPPFVNAVQCDPFGGTPVTPAANCAGTFNLSTPFGSATTINQPTGKAADITNYLQTPANIANGAQMFTFANYAPENKLPYTINYTLDVQWQPVRSVAVELGYVGNLGRHQVIPVPFNQAGIATASNPIHGQTYSYGYAVQQAGASYCFYNCAPANLPNGQPYLATYEGGNIDLRVPYLGYSAESETYKAAGISSYNAFNLHVDKKLSHGLQVGASYTYSHALDEQSDIGLFYNGNNPLNLRDGYASADFDRTHVLTFNYSYHLPSFFAESSVKGMLADGWVLSGITVLQSGQPYSIIDYSGAVGSLYYGVADGITNPIVPLAPGCTPKNALTGASGAFGMPALKSSCFTLPSVKAGSMGVPANDSFETAFTSGQRNIFRQSTQKRADVSLVKELKLKEHYGLRYSFDIFNLTNTSSFDIPKDNVSQNDSYNGYPSLDQAGNFYNAPDGLGYVTRTIGSPRQIQMALRLTY
jgi:hypothetical protein